MDEVVLVAYDDRWPMQFAAEASRLRACLARGRTHHVHVAEPGSEPLLSLRFRDHLSSHPDDAQRSVLLKDELALRYHADREAYTAAKTAFVQDILSRGAQP